LLQLRDNTSAGFTTFAKARSIAAIEPEASNSTTAQVDLRELISHRESVPWDCPLELVHKRFGTHDHEYMAVLKGDDVLGTCSRHDIGMRLGARYGFALFARKPVCEHLSRSNVRVRVGQPINVVLETVFSRADESFYEDVLLLDAERKFLGLIFVHSLVRLQAQFLRENIHLLEQQKRVIHERNQQMEDDLAMAREIQLAILPKQHLCFPASAVPGQAQIHYSQVYRPAQKVGGDFVHVASFSDNTTAVFIADVMGHGVRSALITAMLRAFVEEVGSAGIDPGQLLTQLNRDLTAILHEAGEMMFVTAFYLVADSQAGSLRYACAGHPRPIRLRRSLGTVEVLQCPRAIAGPGLCVLDKAVYVTGEAAIEDDEVILLFTDGLIEASDSKDEFFGIERLMTTVQRCGCLELPALVEAVFAEAEQFIGGNAFDDDVCLAALNVMHCNSPVLQMNTVND
jgi:sigma-B regulation protein RsbU (phosphoserine phosphatase)